MPRYMSLTQRTAAEEAGTAWISVILAIITHPDLSEPLRLSSDPTVRLTHEPLTYGTLHQGHPYRFLLMGARWPDEIEGAPLATELVFVALTGDAVQAVRQLRGQMEVELREVAADKPDEILDICTGLKCSGATGSGDRVSLQISREYLGAYAWPYQRMTYRRFPGLRR